MIDLNRTVEAISKQKKKRDDTVKWTDDEQDDETKKISWLACHTWKVKLKSDEITLSGIIAYLTEKIIMFRDNKKLIHGDIWYSRSLLSFNNWILKILKPNNHVCKYETKFKLI